MAISSETYNKDLYSLLKTKGYRPVPLDFKGEKTDPEQAVVFEFQFKKDGERYGVSYVTVDNNVTVYYDDEQTDSPSSPTKDLDYDDTWSGFLQQMKHWAMNKQLGFDLSNKDRLGDDLAQRKYVMDKENINEGYYPMGKQASYSDAIPTVKIILQHTRQIQEGEQRYRNVSKIFLENQLGERILAPTVRPGIAQVYARHLAEGGVPNDERWNHIKSLCEDYSKMAGFVRAVKNNQFNESAQQLVNEGVNHYQGLRETLGRMRGHRGYNTYFESWTPTLMEDESSDNTLNELFVQETLDPRIESVLPILSKLRKTVGEMKEVNELAEWAEELTEAPGSETLAHNEKTEKQRLDAFDLEESDDAVKAGQVARDKINKPAFMRKAAGEKPATLGDVERSQQHRSSQAMVGQKGQEVEESGLQAYLGNKKYGKAGMDALRKAGRDGASKEKMASIRAKYDKLEEEGMEEGWNDRLDDPDRYEEYLERLRDLADYNRKRNIEDPPQKHKAPTDDSKKQADESVDDMFSLSGKLPPTDRIDKVGGQDKSFDEKMKANTIKHLLQKNSSLSQDEFKGKSAAELISMLREGVAEGLSEMYNRTPSGDRREQRANSPEERNRIEKELQDLLKKTPPELRKKLGLPEPKEQGVAEGSEMNLSDFKAKLSSVLSPRDNTGFKIYPSGTGHRGFALVSIDNKNKGFPMNNKGVAAAADFIRIVKQQYRDEFDNFERTASQQGVAEGLEEQVYKVLAVDKSNALSKQVKLNVKASSLDEVFELLAINDWYPLEINGVEVINGKRLKEQVYKVLAVDKSNALSKQVKLNVKASSLDEVFELLAINDWYPLEINGVEVINGKRLKQGVAEGWKEKVGAAALAGAVATGAGANTPKVPLDQAIRNATAWYNINKAVKKHKEKEADKRNKEKEADKRKSDEKQDKEQGAAVDLDANQKRVGQLGPTEKVKNNNIGKLVGANESLELNEMDKSQPSSDRGGESSGNPYAKGGKAKPTKAKDAAKDAEKVLDKVMDKAHKKDVKEGQEDLDAILRIIRK